MPTFKLGQCSMDFAIEPLLGSLAAADRQLAWRLYLALVSRPAIRGDSFPRDEIFELVSSIRTMLEHWPAAQIEQARTGHLGFQMISVIENILLPCLERGGQAPQCWRATREFLAALARDLARIYKFPDAGANLPRDLLAAWQKQP